MMTEITIGTKLIDLDYLGKPEAIAAALLESTAGAILVDPGPSVCLATLRATLDRHGVRIGDLRAILLTHIHLDHAGAAGSLVRDNPDLDVWVHTRGARHLADPSGLLESARRVYRGDMERRWGDILAVPASRLHPLDGGERLAVGDRSFRVAHTPGHASHHLSFLDETTGIAFVGDTGGNRYSNRPYVSPVTPPPDVDLEAWVASIGIIRTWRPGQLFSAHFGCSWPVEPHLDELADRLHHWSRRVRVSLDDPLGDDHAKANAFASWVATDIRQRLSEADARAYEWGTTAVNSWHGLARYWRGRPRESTG